MSVPLPLPLHSLHTLTRVLDHPLTPGDDWFLLESRWFRALELYIRSRDQQEDHVLSPGPIDNSPLFEPESLSSLTPVIRGRLIEELEYVKIPDEAWRVLVNVFGLMSESHVLKRQVISHTGPSSSYKFVEVYPMRLNLCLFGGGGNDIHVETFSRVTKYSALLCRMREIFNIGVEDDVRLHSNYFQLEDGPDMILADLGLYSDATLQLEIRNEDGSWSSDQEDPKRSKSTPGVCGLINLGHTCFMNTAIQCLSNVPVLTEYLISDAYVSDVNVMNPMGTGGELVNAFADLLTQLWSGDRVSVAPRNFKRIIGQVSSRFSGYEEEDTQELMAFLLDGLHEDLNFVTQKPYIQNPEPSSDKRSDEIIAQEYWTNYKKRNDSKIVDLFHGLLKSGIKCNSCDYSSATFDPYCFLSLPVPAQEYRPVCVTMETVKIDNLLIPTRGSVSDIRDQIVQVLKENGVEAKHENIVLAEMYESRFQYIFRNEDSYSKNLTNIYAHEFEKDSTYVCVYLKSNGKLFGRPLMLNIANLEYGSLTRAIREKLTKRFGEVFEFSLSLVNAYGNIVLEDILPHVPVPKLSRTYVAVNVDPGIPQQYREDADSPTLISCELTVDSNIKITDCLSEFLSPEVMSADDGWFCPQCKSHRNANKKLDIWTLPPVLILHVKRFGFNSMGNDKLDAAFDYPVRGLDMSQFVTSSTGSSTDECLYDLVSVALHYGGLRSGHYTAFGRNQKTGDWFHFKDAKVVCMKEEDVVSKEAYVLFYLKRNIAY